MGFAWHKLVPKKDLIQCPPPCDFTYETVIQDNTSGVYLCPPYNPFDPGSLACANYPGTITQYGGAACGLKEVLEFAFRDNPGGPLEMRLNVPFTCSGNNDPNFGNIRTENINACEMGTASIAQQFYYYRTPNSPSATPTQIASTKLCLKYNPFTIADRFMVISARNRYKYGGWHVDPACPTAGAFYGPPQFWDDPTVDGEEGDPPLGCGIKQFEESLGRQWPLPNSVLNLPLFGADEAPLSPPPSNPGKCGDGACDNGECFVVTANGGSGHYLPMVLDGNPVGNGRGYYSFQCFNPMGYTQSFMSLSNYENLPKSIPTCSIWSFARAIWKRAWKAGLYTTVSNEPDQLEEINNGNPVYPPFAALLLTDPLGLTNASALTAGESNVTAYLRGLKEGMLDHYMVQQSIMPNVFLWDKDAMLAEAQNTNKWKHIYFIGNANVIFDTQCMIGTFNPDDPTPNYAQQDKFGFVIHLDEVAHDPEYGTSGNARLFGFYGCNEDEPNNNNSQANFGLKTMNCAPGGNIGTGTFNTYCDECDNEDTSGLGNIGGNKTQKCVHIGHVEDCSVENGVQGV